MFSTFSVTRQDPSFISIPNHPVNASNTGLNYNPAHWDLRLQRNSPAINSGNNTHLPTGLTTDLDGKARIIHGTVDIGAYEYVLGVRLSAGTLTIHGSNASDWVEIEETSTQIIVHAFSAINAGTSAINASRGSVLAQWKFPISEVTKIEFYGDGGNDTFFASYNGTPISIDCRLEGGGGNNKLVGGNGSDWIYGGWTGNSHLDGGNGDNMVIGGTGNNVFINTGIGSNYFVWVGTGNQWAPGSSRGSNDGFLILGTTGRDGKTSVNTEIGKTVRTFRSWRSGEIIDIARWVEQAYDTIGSYAFFHDASTAKSPNADAGAIYCTRIDRTYTTDKDWLNYERAYYDKDSSIIFIRNEFDAFWWLDEKHNGVRDGLTIDNFYSMVALLWVNNNPFYQPFRNISWEQDGEKKIGYSESDFAVNKEPEVKRTSEVPLNDDRRDYADPLKSPRFDWANTVARVIASETSKSGNTHENLDPRTYYYRVYAVNATGTGVPALLEATIDEMIQYPDLKASDGGTIPASVVYGNTFSIETGLIENIGNAVSDEYTVTFYASTNSETIFTSGSNIELGTVPKSSLDAGDWTTATLEDVTLDVGIWYIGWEIIGGGDTNLDNNFGSHSMPIEVTAKQLDKPNPPTLNVSGGGTIDVSWAKVENAPDYLIEISTYDDFRIITQSQEVTGESTSFSKLQANTT